MEFRELKELKFDLALTGFEPVEVQTSLTKLAWKTAALTEDDALPPTPAQPVTRVGDIWVMGPHRVACGDATETAPVDQLMRGEKADMVFIARGGGKAAGNGRWQSRTWKARSSSAWKKRWVRSRAPC